MRILVVLFIFSPFVMIGQFRGVADFVNFSINENGRYEGQATNWHDHTNKGYYPTGIADTMYLIDANGNEYGIYSFLNPNFNSVDLILENLDSIGVVPFGRGMIYEGLYGNNEVKPIVPDDNQGVSSKLRAEIETRNFKVLGDTINFIMSRLIDTMIVVDDSLLFAYYNRDTSRVSLKTGRDFYQKWDIVESGNDSVEAEEEAPGEKRKIKVLRNGIEVENYVIENLFFFKFPYELRIGEVIEIFYR